MTKYRIQWDNLPPDRLKAVRAVTSTGAPFGSVIRSHSDGSR